MKGRRREERVVTFSQPNYITAYKTLQISPGNYSACQTHVTAATVQITLPDKNKPQGYMTRPHHKTYSACYPTKQTKNVDNLSH
jgi:hypothetical protein